MPPSNPLNFIFSTGTQVVTLRNVEEDNGRTLHPRGSVGVIVKSDSRNDVPAYGSWESIFQGRKRVVAATEKSNLL